MKHFKQIILSLLILLFFIPNLQAETIDPQIIEQIVSQLKVATEPQIMEHCLVFTVQGQYRYAGIAFDHEEYGTIHPFQRIVRRDYNGELIKDETGKELETVLFFVTKIPEHINQVKYRLVLDGLWTHDPLNNQFEFDEKTGLTVSVKEVPRNNAIKTGRIKNGAVQFVYEGEPGENITLSGTFNNWDPFMYALAETRPGYYEIDLPLPTGTYYYNFMNGTERITDKTNSKKAYASDGRIASVLKVQ